MLAAALPILVADDLFGSYVRVYWRHGSSGYLLSILPLPFAALPPWLVAGVGLIAVAIVVAAAGRLIWSRKIAGKGRHRLEIALILSSFAASAVLVLVYAFSSVWASASQSGTVPQESSGLAAVATAVVLLVSLFFNSWRSLVVVQGAVLLSLVAAVSVPRLRAEHRAEVASIHRLLDRAEADLDRRRARWHQIDPNRIEATARDRGQQAGVFRFDERLSNIVDLEAPPRDGTAGVLFAFPRDGRLMNAGGVDLPVENGAQVMPAYPGGTYLTHRDSLSIDATRVGSLFITMTVSAGSYFEVFWSDTDKRHFFLDGIRIPLGKPGQAVSYEIRESLVRFRERGVLHRIWIMPSDRNARVKIAALRILDRTASLGEAPFQAAYENVGDEIRRVLITSTPSTLTWLVPVPSNRPRMRFGLAAADPDVAVTFEVRVGMGEEVQTISTEKLAGAELWRDFELDLSPWAGEETHIALRTSSPVPGLGLWSNPVVFGERAASPNVVVYLVDCLRAQNLGAYGYERPTSSVFDRLVAHGTLFENAYSNGTITKHSIPSLFTSNPISATRVRYVPDVLPAEFPTLAEILRWSGYTTASFATNVNAGPFSGVHQGFSRVYSATRMARAAGHPLDSLAIETLVGPLLEEWMARNRERNFFLYVHTMDAHGPYDPPAPYRKFLQALGREPSHLSPFGGTPVAWDSNYDPEWLTTPSAESRQALYDGELAYGDEHFGRFLSKLREISERQRTVFVFTADHGEYFGEHGMFNHGPPAFVQGTHIPLFLMGPGIPAGKRVAEPVQIMDLLPTVLDAVGLEPDELLFQGTSLLPLARGEEEATFAERGIFIEGSRPDHVSVRVGPFHFINEKNLWFDLRDDPLETRPWSSLSLELALKARARALARRYREVYWEFHDKVAPERAGTLDVDPETLEQLRALGYID